MKKRVISPFIFCCIIIIVICVLAHLCNIIEARPGGDRWAVIVGIDNYKNEITSLQCATNDAREFKKTLIEAAGFREDNMFLLTSDEKGNRLPEKGFVVQWISYVTEKALPGDTFVFFFSGHGMDMDKESYLLTMDANPFSSATLDATALKVSDLKRYLSAMRASTILLFIDACRNDPKSGKGEKDNLLTDNFSKNLIISAPQTSGNDTPFSATFFSCRVGQRSYEWREKSIGFFTHFLVNGLRGEAEDSNGVVTVNSLEKYIGNKVSFAVEREKGSRQDPWVSRSGSSGGGELTIASPGKSSAKRPDSDPPKSTITVTVTPTPAVTVTATQQPVVTVTVTPTPVATVTATNEPLPGDRTRDQSTQAYVTSHTQVFDKNGIYFRYPAGSQITEYNETESNKLIRCDASKDLGLLLFFYNKIVDVAEELENCKKADKFLYGDFQDFDMKDSRIFVGAIEANGFITIFSLDRKKFERATCFISLNNRQIRLEAQYLVAEKQSATKYIEGIVSSISISYGR